MTTPNRFQMSLNDGSCAVAVDGNASDVSDFVTSVDVHAEPDGLPLVVLQQMPEMPVDLDQVGEGDESAGGFDALWGGAPLVDHVSARNSEFTPVTSELSADAHAPLRPLATLLEYGVDLP